MPLGPGESGWTLNDQHTICALLDPQQIGVTIDESFLLHPQKSLSFVVGIGKDTFFDPSRNRCDYCLLQERCRFTDFQIQLENALQNDIYRF
jgi:hypothetical protein